MQGQAVIREVANLISEGFRPRVVVTHGGNGMGLFIQDILPTAIHIGYFEWFFRPETTKFLIEDFNLDATMKGSIRNLPILHELEKCDLGVIPTIWQKKQFPQAILVLLLIMTVKSFGSMSLLLQRSVGKSSASLLQSMQKKGR